MNRIVRPLTTTVLVASLAVASLALAAPKSASAGWKEGVAAYKSGDYATAETEFRGVVEAMPEWPGGYQMLGQTLVKRNKAEAAVAPLEKAHELDPSSFDTLLALGQTYLHAERFADAAKLLAPLRVEAFPSAQQAVFCLTRAKARLQTGAQKAAIPDLECAATRAPKDAESRYLLGSAHLELGQIQPALAVLEEAVALEPRNPRYLRLQAQTLQTAGRTAEGDAKTALCTKTGELAQKLVALEPSYEHHVLLGDAETCLGRHTAAADAFSRALTERPGEWRARFGLGRAQAYVAEVGAAELPKIEARLRAALEVADNDDERTMTRKALGLVYEKQARYAEARDTYRLAGATEGVARATQAIDAQIANAEIDRLAAEEAAILTELEGMGVRPTADAPRSAPGPGGGR